LTPFAFCQADMTKASLEAMKIIVSTPLALNSDRRTR
jgi:hypothetical protein